MRLPTLPRIESPSMIESTLMPRLSTRPPTTRLIESQSMPRSSMRRHTPWLVESPPSPMWQRVSSKNEQIITAVAIVPCDYDSALAMYSETARSKNEITN